MQIHFLEIIVFYHSPLIAASFFVVRPVHSFIDVYWKNVLSFLRRRFYSWKNSVWNGTVTINVDHLGDLEIETTTGCQALTLGEVSDHLTMSMGISNLFG
ncbi:MAG TPA: hypothetical protein O0W88_03835 [Methanocorpusculum sp.]|nr:hypothetical protein [Methanocorpusculum sp.]HJK00850.1 hypothetical protein [Methanocorpusculum sp.]HJK02013.1 hypothetical protein [Methanocorpusculum sp.]